jgi:hypothetical protein
VVKVDADEFHPPIAETDETIRYEVDHLGERRNIAGTSAEE